MKKYLDQLVGNAVIVESREDQLSLIFNHRWVMTIYNKFQFFGDGVSIDSLSGGILVAAKIDDNAMLLDFGYRGHIVVDLSSEAYMGPEALQLIGPDGELIVWNWE